MTSIVPGGFAWEDPFKIADPDARDVCISNNYEHTIKVELLRQTFIMQFVLTLREFVR